MLRDDLRQLDDRLSPGNGKGRSDLIDAKLEGQIFKRIGFAEVRNGLIIFE